MVIGDIIFWTYPIGLRNFKKFKLNIVFDFGIGYIHDIVGRRITIFLGFTIASIAVAAQPWVHTIVPGLFVLRTLTNCGNSGPTGSPLVADYVKQESRGIASAQVTYIFKIVHRLVLWQGWEFSQECL